MSIININKNFNTQDKCVKYLESLRWTNGVVCSHCGGTEHISKRKETHFYHCNECNKDFSVLVGTIFESSRLPLNKWFLTITLMLEARKGIAATQLSRNVDMTYKTSWFTAMKIRCAMIEDIILSGEIEMDETYVGGKPIKNYKEDVSNTTLSQISKDPKKLKISNSKRGRGTSKAKVAGMVERKGEIVLKLMDTFNTVTLLAMLKRNVDTEDAVLITDGAKFYKKFDEYVEHIIVKHKETLQNGNAHTKTIDGFWSLLKAGIKGNYRSLSKKYLPFYLAEFAYRYNRRNSEKLMFEEFIKTALSEEKCMAYCKPILPPKTLTYKVTTNQLKLAKKNKSNMLKRVAKKDKIKKDKTVKKK